MREVKCLSSAAASVWPGRTGSQLCSEKDKGFEAWFGSEGGGGGGVLRADLLLSLHGETGGLDSELV